MKQFFGLLALVALASCGGSGGGGGGNSGPPITDAARAAVIQNVNTQFANIVAAGGDVDSQNVAIAAVMSSMPEFEEAGADAEFDCAWGRFHDGRLLIIGNHPFPEGSSDPFVHGDALTFIATGVTARLGHMFGPGFTQLQTPIEAMSRYLQVDGSFQIVSPPEGKLRLSDYRAVSGDGFVYFNSHGGEGKTKSGQTVFTMVSSTPHDAATDAIPEIKADWDADRLVYYTGNAGYVNGVATYGTWYGINHKFVRDYMSFGQNAIVFLNVCYTANPHIDVGRFRSAFLNKGAGAVLGWTQLCSSESAFKAAKYFVDRLVAKNEFQPENPMQRSFLTLQVLEDMGREGLDRDGNSQLKAFYGTGITSVGLRPSIMTMRRDELNDYLVLHGDFGSQTGIVRVNNVPATLVGGWSDNILITRIPESGPGSDGPVVVEVNGKKSKERFLTSWRGTFTYRFQDSSPNSTLHEEVTANFHIRLDVDDYRETSGGALLESDPRNFYAAGDSTLTWSCGRAVTDDKGVVLSWEGGGTPAFVRQSITVPSAKWTLLGAYDPTTRKLVFGIINGGPVTVHHRDGPDTFSFSSGGGYDQTLNADWSGPPQGNSSGDTQSKFSALTVTWPPPNGYRSPR